jgi:hypothetical protein
VFDGAGMEPADRLLLRALDTEWHLTHAAPSSRRWLDDHTAPHGALAGLGSLGELVMVVRTGTLERSTEIVWALLEIAGSDPFASRVLLQCIVPALNREVRFLIWWADKVAANDLTGDDIDALLLSSVMEAIGYVSTRQPQWPLKAILRRTHRLIERELRSEERWRARVRLDDRPAERLVHHDEPSTAAQLAELLTEAAITGMVSARDVELLWLVGAQGWAADELQDHFGATYVCLRQRQHRAAARVALLRRAG